MSAANAVKARPASLPVDTAAGIVKSIMTVNPDIMIEQPASLAARLLPDSEIKSAWSPEKKESKTDSSVRYRIQVYSDNNRQTAKANAEYRKRLIQQRIPELQGFVSYDAPYWRVRMGNFQTEAEAQTALKVLKSKFPNFASDIRIVKVRVK